MADDPQRSASGDGGLRTAAVRAVGWNAAGLLAANVVRVLFALVLAKLLGPENFGIVGLATLYTMISFLVLDQGFTQALIQRREVSADEIGATCTLNLLLAGVAAAVTLIVAGPVASFFRTPELEAVLRVLSIGLLVKGASATARTMLVRELRFKTVIIVDVSGLLVGGILGVALAVTTGSYWALVAQQLAIDLIAGAGAFAAAGRLPMRRSLRALRPMLPFSRNALGAQLLKFGRTNADNLVVGKALGTVALGQYQLAFRLLSMPLQLFGQAVSQVAFPVITRVQDDRATMARYWLLVARAQSLLIVPLMLSAACVTPVLIDAVFGAQWAPASDVAQILAIVAIEQVIFSLVSATWLACGKATWEFRFGLATTVLATIGFVVGANYGIVGVAFGHLIANLCLLPLKLALTARVLEIEARVIVRALLPAAGGAVAFGATFLIVAGLASPLSDAAATSVATASAIVAYAAWLQAAHRATTKTVLAEVRRLFVRRETAVAA